MKKLWAGRFTKSVNKTCEDFTASIHLDKRLYAYDIAGSIAHATMLAECGIIRKTEAAKIIAGLKAIQQDIENGKIRFSAADEDIHMAIEKRLIERIGKVGEKLHTARSRNDQVVLDVRLYLRDEIQAIGQGIQQFQKTLLDLAQRHHNVVLPGFTHLQHAQAVLLGHYFLAYYFMFKRDKERLGQCQERVNVLPLGVGALAGVNYTIKRELTAKLLGFEKISENSLDTVSDRDFIVEFLCAASILSMHLSRLAEDLILWSSSEFEFIELADEFCTGSSIMPQKKNPDVAELIRGKTGRIYGNTMALLTLMKGLPLSYNRDLQEDKEPLFSTVDTIKRMVEIITVLVATAKINTLEMKKKMERGFLEATDIADYLVLKGIPFRQAHFIVGGLVRYCVQQKKSLKQIALVEYKRFSPVFSEDIFSFISLENCLKRKNAAGGTSPQQVLATVRREKRILR